MNAPRSLSLGTKLNLALLVFLLLLAGAAAAIIYYGFNRAQDDASTRSQGALEEQGKLSLQALVGGIASSGGLQIEWAAEIGHRAARYMAEYKSKESPAAYDVSRFVRTDQGVWYDPDPRRSSDVVVPNHVEQLTAAQLDDIEYSAALDPLFPALVEGFPGELSGAGFRPIAIIFVGLNGVGRYYPPIGVEGTVPAELDVSDFVSRFGPETNPERIAHWTSPYEDRNGRGLVLTAQTPVYEGDVFRGIFEVDLAIDGLAEELNGIHPTPGGFAFYVDSDGGILRSDAFDLLTREAATNPQLASLFDAMKSPGTEERATVERVMLDDREYFLAYTPMPGIGGSIAAAAPIDEVTAEAAPITAGISDQGRRTLQLMLAALAALFIAGLAGATYLNRRLLIRPLTQVADATRRVAGGDLSASVPLKREDELGTLASSFNTMVEQLRESERVLEQRVQDRTSEIRGLLEVARAVSSTLELPRLLEMVLEQTAAALPYDRAAVMLREGDDIRILAVRAGDGPPDETLSAQVGTRLPLHLPEIWDAIRDGEPLIIPDILSDEPIAKAYREEVGPFIGAAMARFRTWMGIPLMAKDEVVGVMTLARSSPSAYQASHAALARAIASQVSIAIENAQLFEQTQRQASLEERQRLARELHDSVSQALYGIVLGTRTARMRLEDDHHAAEPIDYVASLAQAGLAEMRALIFELRPESLEQEGLVAAVEKQGASIAARYGLTVEMNLGEEPDCSLEAKEALYRITQEALHNVVKHAQATHVEIRLGRDDGSIVLAVIDNGRGFDTSQSFPGHVGMQSMPERARKLGGRVTISSIVGEGTTVTAVLPAADATTATSGRDAAREGVS